MTNATIYFPAGTDATAIMDGFADIAAEFNFINESGGPKSKRGNRRELIEAIVGGEIALILLSEDYSLDSHELADLRRMRDEAHPHTAELLSSVLLAIEAAIERREGE